MSAVRPPAAIDMPPPRYSALAKLSTSPSRQGTQHRVIPVPYPGTSTSISQRRQGILDDDDQTEGLLTEHEDSYRIRGRPLLSLRCKSHAGRPEHKPVYFDGDEIEGSVQLMLQKTMHIENIKVQVRGRIAPPETGRPDIFWSSEKILCTAGSRSLRRSLFEKAANIAPGNYSYPFRLQLPLEIEASSGKGTKKYRLPPSYRRSGSSAVLEYEIVITLDRGLFLETVSHSVLIVYLPRSSPEHPSGKRPLSEDSDIVDIAPSPRSPERGSILSSTDVVYIGVPFSSRVSPPFVPNAAEYRTRDLTISGTVFGHRPVQVHCRLMHRLPLIYPRGEDISLLIVLECKDQQALDVFASPDCVSLALHEKATAAGNQVWEHVIAHGSLRAAPTAPILSFHGGQQRSMEGLVNCPVDIKPTFHFATFQLEHFLAIRFAPRSFFTLSSDQPTPRVVQSVQIVTDQSLPL